MITHTASQTQAAARFLSRTDHAGAPVPDDRAAFRPADPCMSEAGHAP